MAIHDKNSVEIIGFLSKKIEFSHKKGGQNYLCGFISTPRHGGKIDTIKFVIAESLMYGIEFNVGCPICIKGKIINKCNEHIPFILANYIERSLGSLGQNDIELSGAICTKLKERVTRYSKRKISSFIIEVTDSNNAVDKVFCIAWGDLSNLITSLRIGTNLMIKGRFQSRLYKRTLSDGTEEVKTLYEVSCSEIEVLENTLEKGGK